MVAETTTSQTGNNKTASNPRVLLLMHNHNVQNPNTNDSYVMAVQVSSLAYSYTPRVMGSETSTSARLKVHTYTLTASLYCTLYCTVVIRAAAVAVK
jgi:hypothetical protein